MKITTTILVMFIGSFIVQYFLMPPMMVNKMSYITNNIGKAYLATIMGLFMVLIEVLMHDHHYGTISAKWYTGIFALVALFVYLYRKQLAINDKQFMEAMIEHHSMGIFMSEEILKKSDNYDVTKLAKNIIQTQNDEIQFMTDFLKKSSK